MHKRVRIEPRKRVIALICFLTIFSIFVSATAETAVLPSTPPTPTTAPTARPYGEPVDGTLRVLLSSLGVKTALGLTIDGVYTVDGDRGFQFQKGTEVKLGIENGSITLMTGGAAIDMGGGFTLKRHLDATGQAGGIYIHESEKDTLFCGDLTFGVRGNSLSVILTIGIEDYLYGVVPYEMSDTFPIEALKAQAVAARTYAMQRKARNQDQDFDVVDTTNDQVFKGYDARYLTVIEAVDATRGVVGMYKGAYAECFYSASNGGQTALATDVWGQGDFGYLDMRDDPFDLENPESVVRVASIPKDAKLLTEPLYGMLVQEAGNRLVAKGLMKAEEAVGLSEILTVEAVKPLYGGESRQHGTLRFTVKASVRRLNELGELGEAVTIEEPLTLELSIYEQALGALNLSINSDQYEMITVTDAESRFLVSARRYGHGVGMSQRGAQWMAGAHAIDYLSILQFYYPGMDLMQMAWLAPTLTPAFALPESLGYAAPRPTPAPPPKPLPALSEGEYYAVVAVEGVDSTLNVREGPSQVDRIVGTLRNGARLIVIEELADGWAKMKTAELEGYVSMRFIFKEGEQVALPVLTPAVEATAAPEVQKEDGAIVF